MLRTTYTSLARNTPAWRTLSTVRSFATAAPTTPPSSDEKAPATKEKRPLSERLGAGRGKALDSSSDPFASFLASAKNNKNNNNNNNRGPNRRNGNFTPHPKKNDNNNNRKPGQFDDAEKNVAAASGSNGEPVKKRNNYNNNRNNNNNSNNNNANNNNNRNRRPQQQAKSTPGQTGEEKRGPRPDRRNNMRRRQQPDEVRTRRATAFIDKDIDWASFDTSVAENAVTVDAEAAVGEDNNNELLLKDMQGDYERYLAVGTDVNWAKAINPVSISTLIGSNATYDYQQKAAFLASLSNATSGGAAARK